MKKNRRSISKALSYQEMGQYWEENANRPFQLRLPAPVYAKLHWAAEKAGKSMHRIALETVRQAVEHEVRKHLG